VPRLTAKLLFFVVLILASSRPVFALDLNVASSASVSASVTNVPLTAPILISPDDNATTNNPREPLVWGRPSPLPTAPLYYYNVYLDGSIFASNVNDGITSQNYYFYNITRVDDTFTLTPNFDYGQGYHTWSVTVYNTYGQNVSSDTRTFYLDSINPFITLQKVESQTLNWSTTDPNSIPDINQRYLTVNTPTPLLTGQVEQYANMQIALVCPQNIPGCSNQLLEGNYPTGDWQQRIYGLLPNLIYSVFISATDAAGNSTLFPEFFLTYSTTSPTPSPTPTATPTPTGTPTPTATPTAKPTVKPTVSPTQLSHPPSRLHPPSVLLPALPFHQRPHPPPLSLPPFPQPPHPPRLLVLRHSLLSLFHRLRPHRQSI
jgi:hypothetical protein